VARARRCPRRALSPVRAVEPGIAAGADRVPVRRRAAALGPRPIARLVRALRLLRHRLRRGHLALRAESNQSIETIESFNRFPLARPGRVLARARRLPVAAAAGGHAPPHPRRGPGPSAGAHPARALPRQLPALLRDCSRLPARTLLP